MIVKNDMHSEENVDYVIVQAGGRGSRMELLTHNKPKALVPVNNLPMLFHLFRRFPTKKFIVIGDYQFSVLEKYLASFASDYDYELVKASGHKGTLAGLNDALGCIPSGVRFMLIWCDLILDKDFVLPDKLDDYIGIAQDFTCRWSYHAGKFAEISSDKHGVAGCFIFKNKEELLPLPDDGEFVRLLQEREMTFHELPLKKTKEYGLYSEWSKLPKMKCRPFNQLRVEENRVYKEGIDAQGKALGKREVRWYRQLAGTNFTNLPHIYSYNPLCMEFIEGHNIYEYSFLPLDQKKDILQQMVGCLQQIHKLGELPADRDSFYEAYIGKTFKRLHQIKDLVPFAQDKQILVNGRLCRNIFFVRDEIEKLVMQYFPDKFCLIHGDCTFSNTLLRHDTEPVFIDPRGYFGTTELFGDPAYDWVKLYYSLVSNYDQFNLKRFSLDIRDSEVRLTIASSGWESLEDEFFRLLSGQVTREQMKLLLALTWLSLTTYAWEDYDSICGAFYQGVYYLEEALDAFECQGKLIHRDLRLSKLEHTWLIDLDGTLVEHNGYLHGQDILLPNAKKLLQQIPKEDKILILTAREEKYRAQTERFLHEQGIRYNMLLCGLPTGERILLNDNKPSNLSMCRAIALQRNQLPDFRIVIDETL